MPAGQKMQGSAQAEELFIRDLPLLEILLEGVSSGRLVAMVSSGEILWTSPFSVSSRPKRPFASRESLVCQSSCFTLSGP